MLGELNPAEIEDVLRSEVIGRIGCISDGRPYVVPVCYVYDGDSIYGHTVEGMKWAAMRANPDVCFEVEHVDDLTHWRSVVAWGRFEQLAGDAAVRGMRLLIDRLAPLLGIDRGDAPPEHTGQLHATVYRILLGEKTGRFETRSATESHGSTG